MIENCDSLQISIIIIFPKSCTSVRTAQAKCRKRNYQIVFAHVLYRHYDYDNCYYDNCGVSVSVCTVYAVTVREIHKQRKGIAMRARGIPQMQTPKHFNWHSNRLGVILIFTISKINDKMKYVNLKEDEAQKNKHWRRTRHGTRRSAQATGWHADRGKARRALARARNQFYGFTATLHK